MRPFSEVVGRTDWQTEVEAWVALSLTAAGLRQRGPAERRRTRPWSTQLVFPTDAGMVWFKANAPDLAFEPALVQVLARLAPDRVDNPLAVDPERGWMLTRGRGPTLADRHEPTLAEWCEIAQEAADLQRRVAGFRDQVVATGVADCSPATVPERFDRLIDRYARLDATHPSHVDPETRRRIEAVRPAVVDAVATLQASPLPVTLDHGDLHPGNVFVVDGGFRLFDFGDAQWAAALEILGATWGWLVQRTPHPWRTVFDAYAEVWSDLVTAAEFEELLAAAMSTLPVNRSLTWWGAIRGATDGELAEWGDAPLSQLSHVLESWP